MLQALAIGGLGAILGRVLAWVIAGVIFKLIVTLGVGFVTYVGMNEIFAGIQSLMVGKLSLLPSTVLQILGLCEVDKAISIIFAAINIRLLLNTFQGGIKALTFGLTG